MNDQEKAMLAHLHATLENVAAAYEREYSTVTDALDAAESALRVERRLAARLFDHLAGLLANTHDERYTDKGGCRVCYDVVEQYRQLHPERFAEP